MIIKVRFQYSYYFRTGRRRTQEIGIREKIPFVRKCEAVEYLLIDAGKGFRKLSSHLPHGCSFRKGYACLRYLRNPIGKVIRQAKLPHWAGEFIESTLHSMTTRHETVENAEQEGRMYHARFLQKCCLMTHARARCDH